jgi:hypothetical protein
MIIAAAFAVAELVMLLICGTLTWIATMALVAEPVGRMIKISQLARARLRHDALCVWLVEDDRETRGELLFALLRERFDVQQAGSEDDVCTLLRAIGDHGLPDLIIAGTEPIRLLAALRTLDRDIPVILAAEVISKTA